MPQVEKRAWWSLCALVFIFAIGTALVQNQSPQPGGVTVFEGARLITGDGSAPIENAAFIVETTASRRSAERVS